MADIPRDIKPLSAADFSPNPFWDINPDELNSEKHIKYIVSRVIETDTHRIIQMLHIETI
jgi:hypothetical protein